MPFERKVPIRNTDFSVIDQEFSSIRERFDAEMKKMEDEMSSWRSQAMERSKEFFQRTSSTSTKSHSESSTMKNEPSSWLEDLNSPLVHDSEDGKLLKLRFDVSQYEPEEIVVKTVDNKLQVHAKHEEKSENRSVYREYNREFLLPKDTNPENIKSSLSKDGVLTIEAPLPVEDSPKERMIPIDKK